MKSYAAQENNSWGRVFKESIEESRSEFDRDYARIMHSQAFRRLQYKTQVFPNEDGDLFRTRAMHSLEVAQIGRATAKRLGLNERLVEVLALGHDLGHTPFGHKGQHVLNDLMSGFGGFEHNWQSIRLVDHLEKISTEYNGLNLMFETREGLLKYCNEDRAKKLGLLGERFLKETEKTILKGYKSPSLEAQVMDLTDAIAYTFADLEDSFQMNLIDFQMMQEVPLLKEKIDEKEKDWGHSKKWTKSHLKMLTSLWIKDALDNLVKTSSKELAAVSFNDLNEVRKSDKKINFSEDYDKSFNEVKRFLRNKVYFCEYLLGVQMQQEEVLRTLFEAYLKNPKLMNNFNNKKKEDIHRDIADYIAGMTDRFALQSFRMIQSNRNDRKRRVMLKSG